jgi:hypothetical protein
LIKPDNLVEVYHASNNMEAQVIRSLLESFDIPCILKSNAAPSVHLFTMDGMAEVRVMVPESLAEQARTLINEGDSGSEIIDTPASIEDEETTTQNG